MVNAGALWIWVLERSVDWLFTDAAYPTISLKNFCRIDLLVFDTVELGSCLGIAWPVVDRGTLGVGFAMSHPIVFSAFRPAITFPVPAFIRAIDPAE